MRRIAFIVLAPAILAACNVSQTGRETVGINVATAETVAGCAPVTRLRTTPGLMGPALRDEAFGAARNRMAREALSVGADTIVFEIGGPEDAEALFIEGVAYRCQG